MGNILGDNLKPWVKKQIDIRQRSLGKINRDPNDHHYAMTKAPFLRLASSVNVFDFGENSVLEKLIRENFPRDIIEGDQLANNLVLKGGVDLGKDSSAYGINIDKSPFKGSYGFANVDDRGYVPMPGLTNAKVTYYNNGALSKTLIDIKCYSRAQFQLIDALYLRPGYTLLLEFGWSQYLDTQEGGDEPVILNNQGDTLPFKHFMEGDLNQYELYTKINEEKELRAGNYEAIFGKISNFNWQFLPDGTYSIQIQLTAVGDVIESLKSDINYKNKNDFETFELNNTKFKIDSLEDNTNSPKLELFLKKIEDAITESFISTDGLSPAFYGVVKYNKVPTSQGLQDVLINNAVLYIPQTYNEESTDRAVYIKYGLLMAFIQKHLLLYDKKTKLPLFEFDMNFNDLENDENYILYPPGQYSADPRVCLIPLRDFNISDTFLRPITYDKDIVGFNGLEKMGYQFGKYTGRLANMMVNVNAIRNIFNSTKETDDEDEGDEVDTINTVNFIKNLNEAIKTATGGINNIDLRHSQDGLKIQFIEDIPQTFTEDIISQDSPTILNMYGVKPGNVGSFVRGVNLTANLSNEFASMISIGAQADGSSIGENSTSFSSYNKGLIDRIIPTKVTSDNVEDIKESNHEKLFTIVSNSRELMRNIYSYIFTDKEISDLKVSLKESLTLALAILEKNSIISSPFFLPFTLSLQLDGISGMILYQKFKVTDEVLPPYYTQNDVNMIIKGIDHNISANGWTTSVNTLTIPDQRKSLDEGIIFPSENEIKNLDDELGLDERLRINPPPKDSPSPLIDDREPPQPKPNGEEILRARLVRLMDDGTQTLGYMEILDPTGQEVIFTFATSELPWRDNRNKVSCIPTGKYKVESNISPNYGKCFWVKGSEEYNYTKIKSNGFTRTLVKIHHAPKAPGWLEGCIAPGFKFNDKANQKGRQKGTGTNYLNPAKTESIKANRKLVNMLFNEGSFLMTIEDKTTQLPTNFTDIRDFIKTKGLL
jgi:hypothetical protein